MSVYKPDSGAGHGELHGVRLLSWSQQDDAGFISCMRGQHVDLEGSLHQGRLLLDMLSQNRVLYPVCI